MFWRRWCCLEAHTHAHTHAQVLHKPLRPLWVSQSSRIWIDQVHIKNLNCSHPVYCGIPFASFPASLIMTAGLLASFPSLFLCVRAPLFTLHAPQCASAHAVHMHVPCFTTSLASGCRSPSPASCPSAPSSLYQPPSLACMSGGCAAWHQRWGTRRPVSRWGGWLVVPVVVALKKEMVASS